MITSNELLSSCYSRIVLEEIGGMLTIILTSKIPQKVVSGTTILVARTAKKDASAHIAVSAKTFNALMVAFQHVQKDIYSVTSTMTAFFATFARKDEPNKQRSRSQMNRVLRNLSF